MILLDFVDLLLQASERFVQNVAILFAGDPVFETLQAELNITDVIELSVLYEASELFQNAVIGDEFRRQVRVVEVRLAGETKKLAVQGAPSGQLGEKRRAAAMRRGNVGCNAPAAADDSVADTRPEFLGRKGQEGGVLAHALVDRTAAGDEVRADGEFQLRKIAYGPRLLNRPLSDRRGSHDQTSIPILDSAGDDFGGAGGGPVHQYHQGPLRVGGVLAG